MNRDLLSNGLSTLGLESSGSASALLARYVEAIEAWNPAYGLVGASGDELIIKHILDSLAPIDILMRLGAGLHHLDSRLSLIDLGTGAGLPGIPLAIALPQLDVTLLDRMTRRINFLKAMKDDLGLTNVDIVEQQAEHAKGRFDLVTFRAFRPFERKLFKRVFSVCSPKGFVVAYKGKADKVRLELQEIEGLYSSCEIVPVKVPFLDDERCVVVLRPT